MNENITIMLIEADRTLAKWQECCLGQHQIATILVGDTETALDLGRRHHPDGVICAAEARPASGAGFCRAWRRTTQTPVLIFTARYNQFEADEARDAGASEYVSSSIEPDEFVARVRAMLRHSNSDQSHIYDIGPIRVDAGACDVRCGGRDIGTTATEFRILRGMARSPGHVFNRNRIAYLAGTTTSDAMERTVDAHIKNIRRKLGVYAPILQTVRGFGYRISGRPEDASV